MRRPPLTKRAMDGLLAVFDLAQSVADDILEDPSSYPPEYVERVRRGMKYANDLERWYRKVVRK